MLGNKEIIPVLVVVHNWCHLWYYFYLYCLFFCRQLYQITSRSRGLLRSLLDLFFPSRCNCHWLDLEVGEVSYKMLRISCCKFVWKKLWKFDVYCWCCKFLWIAVVLNIDHLQNVLFKEQQYLICHFTRYHTDHLLTITIQTSTNPKVQPQQPR